MRGHLFFIFFLTPLFLFAQVSMEEIGEFRCLYGSETSKTIYQLSYKGFNGEYAGSDGDFGGRVSPSYWYIIEKTKNGTRKYWQLGFTGRSNRKTGFTMKKGGLILIKLFDDNVISLKTKSVEIKEDYDYGTWFQPTAVLSDINFKKITETGVKKIRFETFPKVFDVEYDVDVIGDFLRKAAPVLKEKINDNSDRMKKGF